MVAHCAWARRPQNQINIEGVRNVLDAMTKTGAGRVVFASSAHLYSEATTPATEDDAMTSASTDGLHTARVEKMLANSGMQWVAIRSALVVGRGVDNWVRRELALLVLPDIGADHALQVIHTDDALRLFIRAIMDTEINTGPVNLAALGEKTFRQIAARLGRPIVPLGSRLAALRSLGFLAELKLLQSAPLIDTSRPRDKWEFVPVWNFDECIDDFTLAIRGRVSLVG